MAVQTFQTARQFLCIFFAVIYPCDQTVLKSDPPSCLGKIISAGLQKFIYRIFVGNRHQFPSFFIVRCMKRYCKCHLKLFICQFINSRNQPTCRYRKISLTDMDSSIFGQNMNKSEKIIIIIKRLTGSHHHHIGDTLSDRSLYPVNLIQHLRRKKISRQPTDRRCTEAAAHTAACLRRNTDGISVFISHQDTLDHISIRKAEQILSGSIYFGSLNIQFFQNCDGIIFQLFFQALRNICHFIIGGNKMLMQPAIDLLCAERLFTDLHHKLFQLLHIH